MTKAKTNRWLRIASFTMTICLTGLTSCQTNKATSQAVPTDYTQYVDPTIGNVVPFLVPTYPTFQLPNQMLRMFPLRKDYISDEISAFPLQVAMHRRPGFFQMKVGQGKVNNKTWKTKMVIDPSLEIFHPWLYSTYLINEDITVSFTPNKHSALYKLDFDKHDGQNNILFSGTKNLRGKYTNGTLQMSDKIVYKTRGTKPETRIMPIFAYVRFENEQGDVVKPEQTKIGKQKVELNFSSADSRTIYVRYGISYIDSKQAKENLTREINQDSFDNIAKNAHQAWKKVINQIAVDGGTTAEKRTFYTSLYRTYERMVDINEYGRYYSAYDGKVHESTQPFYVDDWTWDTYRAQHPLRTILNPEQEGDMLQSYVDMYSQSGWMPTFPQVHGNHMCMNSYHSSPLFIDAYRKGIRNFDVEKAYLGMKKNLTQGTFIPWRQGIHKLAIDDFFHTKGYFPALHPGEKETIAMMDDFEKRQAVPVTLGVSYDFWCMTELAKEICKDQDVQTYGKYSSYYKNLWHPDSQLFIPKDNKGQWIDINPKSAGGPGYRDYYDENNGWTYAWDVQHDIPGLIQLLGGKKKAETRLDQLFREPLGMKKNLFYVNGSNSTGLVGQFSMGNEPSFHIPYLYNYFGAPWKTQRMTRRLLNLWFPDNLFGVPGDEDGGGMSAFVVFTAMGLYPATPGIPTYTITSPIFEKTSIQLNNGKKFTVEAPGASKRVKYIQQATLNGEVLDTPFVSHEQIMQGGILHLTLGELPNKAWGTSKNTGL